MKAAPILYPRCFEHAVYIQNSSTSHVARHVSNSLLSIGSTRYPISFFGYDEKLMCQRACALVSQTQGSTLISHSVLST